MAQNTHHLPSRLRSRRAAGLSLAEMLISLAVVAVLLTAVTVALDASFRAYANAAESASYQSSTRMITQRVLSLIRNGVAQGPLANHVITLNADGTPAADAEPFPYEGLGISDADADFVGDTGTSNWLILQMPSGRFAVLRYFADDQQLRYFEFDGTVPKITADAWVPLLDNVTACQFTIRSRVMNNRNRDTVLRYATMRLTVQPAADGSLAVERGNARPIEVIATTAPRRLGRG